MAGRTIEFGAAINRWSRFVKGKMETKSSRLQKLRDTSLGKFLLPQIVIRRDLYSRGLAPHPWELERLLNFGEQFRSFVVRSSAFDEDVEGTSQAGRYLSLLDIPLGDIKMAIADVFASYKSENNDDEVLIQPFISNSSLSGVIFTHDPSSGSPYRVFNFHIGSDTTAVTAGKSDSRTVVSFHDSLQLLPAPLRTFTGELSEIFSYFKTPVDIEFVCQGANFYIVQYRTLVVKEAECETSLLGSALREVQIAVARMTETHPYLVGDTSALGVMPDWNPAELIGVRPSALAFSLFRELITDGIWAYERDNLGYRNTRSFPLLVSLAGHPYIDMRVSINSLIPASIEDCLANKLANCYLQYLVRNRHLHDKVEFEVYLTAWSFDFKHRIEKYSSMLSQEEVCTVEAALLEITRRMISAETGLLKPSLDRFEVLSSRFKRITQSKLDPLAKLYWLIEDCKRYGTLPFSGVARMAFVGKLLLDSLERMGHLNSREISELLSSVDSPANRLIHDSQALDKNMFLERYGHLRPGTFDIRVPNYRSGYDTYFRNPISLSAEKENDFREIGISVTERPGTSESLNRLVSILGTDLPGLTDWCLSVISAREKGKFLLSRNISAALELIGEIGSEFELTLEDLANSSIQTYLEAYRGSADLAVRLHAEISSNKQFFKTTSSAWLPPLITEPSEVFCFTLDEGHPSFIGQDSVSGPVQFIEIDSELVPGKILLIRSADPGYDWIFTRGVIGMITCYGGANSHMAVRCKELGIPAAIGVGEIIFDQISRAQSVLLDCMGKRIEVIR